MFEQIIIAIFCGVTSGIITGLTPGIHINLISAMLLALSPFFLENVQPIPLVCFIIAMSVVHTFLDAIPSIFLGAPDSAQALGVLPGHRFLLKGKGLFALKLTVLGSFGAVLLSTILFPFFVLIIIYIYPFLEDYIKYFIVLIILFMIARDRHKVWALLVFVTAGGLGYIVLNMNSLDNPLFPLLSGLFGISTLLYSLKDNNALPEQKDKDGKIPFLLYIKSLFSGCFSGYLTAVTPGLGAGMASVISSQITRKLGDKGFMILVGSISTFNMILSLATYHVLDKARNGSIIAVQKLIGESSLYVVFVLILVVLIAGSIAVPLALIFGRFFKNMIKLMDYKKIVLSIILFIVFLTVVLSGPVGIMILITSTAVGLVPAIKKTTRTMGMGCLIIPVLIYLFG